MAYLNAYKHQQPLRCHQFVLIEDWMQEVKGIVKQRQKAVMMRRSSKSVEKI
jgi:hypothetical protein